jgi:hypothetical protein
MKTRTPTEQEKRLMQQWRVAAAELPKIKRQELRAMTNEQALRATNRLLSLVGRLRPTPRRRAYSGLVQQQALFHRRAPE